MGGRHNNFRDWMNVQLSNYEKEIFKIYLFIAPRFKYNIYHTLMSYVSCVTIGSVTYHTYQSTYLIEMLVFVEQ
jgi:hypothetical protein